MTNRVEFYGASAEHGFLSNFSRASVWLKGCRWPTAEHYFQAQKFAGTHHEHEIRNARTAGTAAEMGRDRRRPLRADWESVKDEVMREAVRAQFTQHAELREALLATGDAELVEHTYKDSYWGDGGDGTGKNMLGLILMEIRAELRSDNE